MIAHKKNFRARANTTLKGLTTGPNIAHDSLNAHDTSMAVRGSSRAELSMSAGRENKKEPRSKVAMKGLTIDTRLARDSYNAENTCNAANARLARRVSNADSPRLSEAMMNRNWRHHRNHLGEESPDKMEHLWSAPPEQSKYLDEIKARPRRKDEYEIIDYDHGLKRVAYRSRRPDDVRPDLIPFTKPDSINSDPCLSAPATKMEFSTAKTGTEERSEKYTLSVFQPSVKSIVRLDEMAPIKRAGYEKILNWDEQQRRGLRDSSSITVVSLGSLGDPSSSWEAVEFPYAEIRAVQGGKKFETGLSHVEETIRNQLSTLVEPQSASLPPEYIRKKYEETREERQKAMALTQSTQSTLAARVSRSGVDCKEGANDTQFNDLLGKLNKLCAPRIRAFTVNDKDDQYRPTHTNESEKIIKGRPHSPSGDSGVSGLSSGGRRRSSTLNPEAVEFRCTMQDKQSPVTTGCNSAVSGPTVPTSATQTSKQTLEPTDPIRLLETRVAELEAQIAQHKESKQEQPARQRWTKGNKTNQVPYGAKGSSPMIPGGGVHYPAMNRNTQGQTGYQAVHPLPYPQLLPSLPIGTAGMQPNLVAAMGNCGLPQVVPGFVPNGMPAGIANQCNATQAMIPFAGPGAPVPAKPASGTPLWIKSVFGPKPVSKPDRPFRPGDGVQAMRQQEYEEYLEHLRATDPNYALSCKQRQARRADRRRLPAQHDDDDDDGSAQKVPC